MEAVIVESFKGPEHTYRGDFLRVILRIGDKEYDISGRPTWSQPEGALTIRVRQKAVTLQSGAQNVVIVLDQPRDAV